jgi:hypothetical protein
MTPSTFLQTLKAEVARMQSLAPEREGEFARAHALILNGQVLPTEDPETGMVLSSDGEKRYEVNGTCNCQAGQHGQGCKHLQAWKLYKFIRRKVEAQPTPPALPEAPASVNLKVLIGGHEVMVTLRDADEGALLTRLQALLKRQDLRPIPKPTPRSGNWKRSNQGRS